MKKPETLSIEEVEQKEEVITLPESVSRILTPEEIIVYENETVKFLSVAVDISFETRLMALTLLKTLSHLSGNKDPLFSTFERIPFKKHRLLYYVVPFLSEIAGKGNLLKWYQEEAEYATELEKKKGDFGLLEHLIYLYESVIFRMVMDKKNRDNYLLLAESVLKEIRENLQDLQIAFEKKDVQHSWMSLDKSALIAFKKIINTWKTIVNVTTIRHGGHLPVQFRRPPGKLPFEWAELIRIKKANKVSMINAIYPLRGLSSQCREIRTYSSFILNRVCEERPGFLESLKHSKVERSFVNRLRVAYQINKKYPIIPLDVPGQFQQEMFLILIEYAINSLAKKFELGDKGKEDLQENLSKFSEHVQTKDEVNMEEVLAKDEVIEPEPPKEEKAKFALETDYPALTDDQELGMGMQTMPFIFPFTYEDEQEELPLEHVPNIKWDEMKWNAMNAQGVKLQVAEAKIFVKKLEIIPSYRYEIFSLKDYKPIKPYQQFSCFIIKMMQKEGVQYYIAKKGGKKNEKGVSSVFIALDLSEQYLKNIDRAFFFIFPAPYNQHILAIPR
ncbi:MAG: hypothetical protein HQM13_10340 [SAR324 cluster bacterium]|nr:hypothetical protein [SAR324 cluster bacterium]